MYPCITESKFLTRELLGQRRTAPKEDVASLSSGEVVSIYVHLGIHVFLSQDLFKKFNF